MKKHLLSLALLFLVGAGTGNAQVLTGFGTAQINPFDPTSDFEDPWTGTVNSTLLKVSNVSNSGGGIYDQLGTPVSISTPSTAFLALSGALTLAPTIPKFQIVLYDSAFDSLVYNYDWNSFTSSPSTVVARLLDLVDSAGAFDGTVSSWTLNGGGNMGDTLSFNFTDLASTASPTVVPEPSSLAMVGLGLLVCVLSRRMKFLTWLRRREVGAMSRAG